MYILYTALPSLWSYVEEYWMAFYFHVLVAHSFVFKYCVVFLYHHSGTYEVQYMVPLYYQVFFFYLGGVWLLLLKFSPGHIKRLTFK
jgi:hypothetical protein